MAEFFYKEWEGLPEHILVNIYTHLSAQDRLSAARVCASWYQAFRSPLLWHNFIFRFELPQHENRLQIVDTFGKALKHVRIEVNQGVRDNRQNACKLLESLRYIDKRRLTSLEILFTFENPLFYAGKEFVDGLTIFLSPVPSGVEQPLCGLSRLKLSGLSVAYDDSVIDTLSENHPDLESLDIQNRMLICKVTPSCVCRLVRRCRKLKDLRVFHCSLSDAVLEAFCEDDRAPLDHLSIVCRREEKYGTDLSSEVWGRLSGKIPTLRVSMRFDHTCLFALVPVILKPEIPMKTLKLETFTRIFDEVNLTASYYSATLEKLVLQTRSSEELYQALLNLARNCKSLKCLMVYCVVRRNVVEEILNMFPDMRERGSYILRWERDPEPWTVVGVEEGD